MVVLEHAFMRLRASSAERTHRHTAPTISCKCARQCALPMRITAAMHAEFVRLDNLGTAATNAKHTFCLTDGDLKQLEGVERQRCVGGPGGTCCLHCMASCIACCTRR